MNITLQVVIEAAGFTHPDPEHNAAMERPGDIIAVYDSSTIKEPPNPNTRLGFVHITNAPNVALEKAKRLMGRVVEFSGGGMVIRRKRKWRIPPSVLPTAVKQALKTNREVTVDWSQVKPFIRRKVIVNNLDPTKDDESNAVTDADIS